jgi:predicted metalloendopeptidase
MPLPDQTINGQLTLGENISDLGGIKIAYDAFQLANARAPAASIGGFTPDQRFFLAFATIWRGKYRNAALLDQLRTDSHSPPRYRVLGPLANFPAFGKAFTCAPEAPMLRPAADQIVIW